MRTHHFETLHFWSIGLFVRKNVSVAEDDYSLYSLPNFEESNEDHSLRENYSNLAQGSHPC